MYTFENWGDCSSQITLNIAMVYYLKDYLKKDPSPSSSIWESSKGVKLEATKKNIR